MNLVIFDGELLFEEDGGYELSSEAIQLLGCRSFMKAAVLAGSLNLALKRTSVLGKSRLNCHVTTEFNCLKAYFFKNIKDFAGLFEAKDIFVVAHVNAPDIYFGNKLGFKTIGILRGNPPSRHALFPDSEPSYTRWSIGEVPKIVRPDQPLLPAFV